MPVTESPLRYPGGKTKLYSVIQPIVNKNINNGIYIEPFAGGCGLALKMLINKNVKSIVLNDIDTCIYNFWKACLTDSDKLINKIVDCSIDIESWDKQKEIYRNHKFYSDIDVAFATLFLNRCNVSGIIQGGPIGGRLQDRQNGINARFNKNTIVRKIKLVNYYSKFIEFYNLDASIFLEEIVPMYNINNTLLNIDPPYVKKGKLLYENSFTKIDHENLAKTIKKIDHKWIVTYDKCEFIESIYADFQKEDIILKYSAGKTKQGNELLIFGNNIVK